MTNLLRTPDTAVWPASLATATVLGSLALACVFPFATFAALAALTLDRRSSAALIAAAWGVNQAVGFFLLSFPWDAQAVGHGIAILAATLIACEVARFTAGHVGPNLAVRSAIALVSAFAAYQLLLRAYASVGGGAENFSTEIIMYVARNDVVWFLGLLALRVVLTRAHGNMAIARTA